MARRRRRPADRFDQPHRHVELAEHLQPVKRADDVVETQIGEILDQPRHERHAGEAAELPGMRRRPCWRDEIGQPALKDDGPRQHDEGTLHHQPPQPISRIGDDQRQHDADDMTAQRSESDVVEAAHTARQRGGDIGMAAEEDLRERRRQQPANLRVAIDIRKKRGDKHAARQNDGAERKRRAKRGAQMNHSQMTTLRQRLLERRADEDRGRRDDGQHKGRDAEVARRDDARERDRAAGQQQQPSESVDPRPTEPAKQGERLSFASRVGLTHSDTSQRSRL